MPCSDFLCGQLIGQLVIQANVWRSLMFIHSLVPVLTVCWGFSAGILGRFLGRLLLIFRRWLCQPLGVYLSNWNRASLLPLFSYLYLFIYIYILLPSPPPWLGISHLVHFPLWRFLIFLEYFFFPLFCLYGSVRLQVAWLSLPTRLQLLIALRSPKSSHNKS